MLVDGKWTTDWQPVQASDAKGGFLRQTSSFRNWITPDGSPGPSGTGGFKPEAGRYHLYVALICPWASRTLIARRLKGLDQVVSLSVVEPEISDQGWRFATPDPGPAPSSCIRSIRGLTAITGRATMPVLWDKQTGHMVNNESAEILRMFNSGFRAAGLGA